MQEYNNKRQYGTILISVLFALLDPAHGVLCGPTGSASHVLNFLFRRFGGFRKSGRVICRAFLVIRVFWLRDSLSHAHWASSALALLSLVALTPRVVMYPR